MKDSTYVKYCNVVDEWFVNGRNGTKAYQKFYPKAQDDTAAVKFNELVRIGRMQDYINLKQENISKSHGITLEGQVKELEGIISKYKEMIELSANEQLDPLQEEKLKRMAMVLKGTNALAAMEQIHKMVGLYEKDNNQKQPRKIIIDLVDDDDGQS